MCFLVVAAVMKADVAVLRQVLRKQRAKSLEVGSTSGKKAPKTPQTPKVLVEVAGEAATSTQTDHQGSAEQRVVIGGEAECWPSIRGRGRSECTTGASEEETI